MKPVIALRRHSLWMPPGPSQTRIEIGLGATFGAVAGVLIGGMAGNALLGGLFGAILFAFAMRPRFSRHISKG